MADEGQPYQGPVISVAQGADALNKLPDSDTIGLHCLIAALPQQVTVNGGLVCSTSCEAAD